MTDLTDLERAVLGVVWRDGSCTPYQIRKQFLESPTPSWSGSAGSIYPLVRRLESMELLVSEDAGRDKRGTRLYRVTAAGKRALKQWIGPDLPDDAIVPGEDPLRTRLLFIDVLTDKERRTFLDAAVERLEDAVDQMRDLVKEAKDSGQPVLVLASRGRLGVARARLAWYREVRETLG